MAEHDTDDAIPILLRAARGAYAQSMRARWHAVGIDDLPRNAAFILAGIDDTSEPRPDLPAGLGVTKQAVSQLIDTLVQRGYIERGPDPDDRRRVTLTLTDLGRQVVEVGMQGIEAVDRQLLERVSPAQVEGLRSALRALADIKNTAVSAGTGRRRSARQLRTFSPIFPVRRLPDALAHYTALGFKTSAYEEGDHYGFADRDGTGLHLAVDHDHDSTHAASTYLYVRDADALYEEWSRPGIGGRTLPVGPTAYKLREGSHIDPDGNLIRFGSPVDE